MIIGENPLNLSESGYGRGTLFRREEIEAAAVQALSRWDVVKGREHAQRGKRRLHAELRQLAGRNLPNHWELLPAGTALGALDLLLRDRGWTGDAAGAAPADPAAMELMRLHGLDVDSLGSWGSCDKAVNMTRKVLLYLEAAPGWESVHGRQAAVGGNPTDAGDSDEAGRGCQQLPECCRLAILRQPDSRWGSSAMRHDGMSRWFYGMEREGPSDGSQEDGGHRAKGRQAGLEGVMDVELAAIGSLTTGIPGVEAGWIAAPPEIIARLAMLQRHIGWNGGMGDVIVEELLHMDGLAERLAAAAEEWEPALSRMENTLLSTMPPSTAWRRAPDAGKLLVLLPEGLSHLALAKAAMLKGIAFSGSSLPPGRGRRRSILSLSCAAGSGLSQLEQGIGLLAETIKEFEARS